VISSVFNKLQIDAQFIEKLEKIYLQKFTKILLLVLFLVIVLLSIKIHFNKSSTISLN